MRSILLIELDTDHNNPFVKVYKKKWIKDNLLKVKSKGIFHLSKSCFFLSFYTFNVILVNSVL